MRLSPSFLPTTTPQKEEDKKPGWGDIEGHRRAHPLSLQVGTRNPDWLGAPPPSPSKSSASGLFYSQLGTAKLPTPGGEAEKEARLKETSHGARVSSALPSGGACGNLLCPRGRADLLSRKLKPVLAGWTGGQEAPRPRARAPVRSATPAEAATPPPTSGPALGEVRAAPHPAQRRGRVSQSPTPRLPDSAVALGCPLHTLGGRAPTCCISWL